MTGKNGGKNIEIGDPYQNKTGKFLAILNMEEWEGIVLMDHLAMKFGTVEL